MHLTGRRRLHLRSLVGFTLASYLAAAIGSAFTFPALGAWYRTLRKPAWTPPDRVFGPVWTVLYTLMAVSAWLVRRSADRDRRANSTARAALRAWAVQLALNVTWPAVFFGRRTPAGGVGVIAALWLAIAVTITLAARVSRPGGMLLVPYLAWTSFAAALNWRIWRLNA